MSAVRIRRATVVAAAVLASTTHSVGAAEPQASGQGEPIAAGVVGFTDGTFHWQVASHTVAGPAEFRAPDAVTFVLAGDGALDVAAGSNSVELVDGEATMLDAFSGATISPAGTDAAFWTVSLADVEQSGGRGATGARSP